MDDIVYYRRCGFEAQTLADLIKATGRRVLGARAPADLRSIANQLRFISRQLDEQAAVQTRAVIAFAAGEAFNECPMHGLQIRASCLSCPKTVAA